MGQDLVDGLDLGGGRCREFLAHARLGPAHGVFHGLGGEAVDELLIVGRAVAATDIQELRGGHGDCQGDIGADELCRGRDDDRLGGQRVGLRLAREGSGKGSEGD